MSEYDPLAARIIDRYVADGEGLLSQLPPESDVAVWTGLLLDMATTQSLSGNAESLSLANINLGVPEAVAEGTFVVVEESIVNYASTSPNSARRLGSAVAFVTHGDHHSVMVLPEHDPAKPMGNAIFFTHELDHIAHRVPERAAHKQLETSQTPEVILGELEVRAYRFNVAQLIALDGSDLTNYILHLPVDVHLDTEGAVSSLTFPNTNAQECPEPPKDTAMHQMWREGGSSRRILQYVSHVAMFDMLLTPQDAARTTGIAFADKV